MTDFITTIQWREPLWLLVALQPILLLLLSTLRKKISHQQFTDPHLSPWVTIDLKNKKSNNKIKTILMFIAWLAFSIALSGPRVAEKIITSDTSNYTNIMVVFDVSRSMSARDVIPSRLERAKLELYDFIDRSQQSRIGIIVYAAKPHLLSPLTTDKDIVRRYVSTIATPLLPTRGSNLKSALQLAAKTLTNGNKKHHAILLISDGGSDHSSIEPLLETLSTLKDKNISVHTLISGTENGAPLLANEAGWLTYKNQGVVTKLDKTLLQDVAVLTNGTYSEIKDNDTDWQKIYHEGIAPLHSINTNNVNNTDLIIWHELYSWCLAIAVLLFLLAHWNPVWRPTHVNIYKNQYKNLALIALFISGFYSSPSPSYANEIQQKAFKAYQQQQYQEAAELYSQASGYEARMGEASAVYSNKNYKKSIALFIQATLEAKTNQQRAHSLFNLANSYYQLEYYEQAEKIYQDVLRYQPNMEQAKVNLAYANALDKKQQETNKFSITKRGGKGPRTARLEPNSEIGKGSLTLGDDNDEIAFKLPSSNIDSENKDAARPSAGLVTQDIEKTQDTQWTYQIKSADQISLISNSLKTDESVLWQRLFEWEEGFPAPLAEPYDVPGVKPW